MEKGDRGEFVRASRPSLASIMEGNRRKYKMDDEASDVSSQP